MELTQAQPFRKFIGAGLVFIAGGFVGAVAGYAYTAQTRYQAGFMAAKNLVEKSNLEQFITSSDIRTLSGTVTAVQGESVMLRTVSNDPFQDPALTDRTVRIVPATQIALLVRKDPQAFQSEVLAYMNRKTASSTPPNPLTPTPATFSTIKIGDYLTVTAAENIKTAHTFTATEIQIAPEGASDSLMSH